MAVAFLVVVVAFLIVIAVVILVNLSLVDIVTTLIVGAGFGVLDGSLE